MKSLIKNIISHTPYRLVRASGKNRFGAIWETLLGLKRRGYRPKIIVDGGANIGGFSQLAKEVFHSQMAHMIEPQPACAPILEKIS